MGFEIRKRGGEMEERLLHCCWGYITWLTVRDGNVSWFMGAGRIVVDNRCCAATIWMKSEDLGFEVCPI